MRVESAIINQRLASVRAHEEGVHRREIGPKSKPCMNSIPMSAASSVAVFHFFM